MPQITFVQPDESTTTIDAEDGLSVMEVARINDVSGIIGQCGGSLVCSSCHVHVAPEWMDKVGSPDNVEEMMLEMVEGADENSRLCCQIIVNDTIDGLRVRVPLKQLDLS